MSKIIYEVIGWTGKPEDYGCEGFEAKSNEDYEAARYAVIKEIRKHGYSFAGDLFVDFMPVLNNGKVFDGFSWRGWGAVMADAWKNPDDYAYMLWYMDDYNVEGRPVAHKYPDEGVDKSRIVPNADKVEFSTDLKDYGYDEDDFKREEKSLEEMILKDFESTRELLKQNPDMKVLSLTSTDAESFQKIKSGEQTVVVFLDNDENIKVGNSLRFACDDPEAGGTLNAEIVGTEWFLSFEALFSVDMMLEKTGFKGLTPKEAAAKMYEQYGEEDEQNYGVLAVEIKVE